MNEKREEKHNKKCEEKQVEKSNTAKGTEANKQKPPEWIALHGDISQRIGRHWELCRVVLARLWSLGPHHSFERQPTCLSKVCEAR